LLASKADPNLTQARGLDRTDTPKDTNETAVLNVLQDYHRAMVDAAIGKPEDIVDRRFSLTHTTGYVQLRDEWFYVVRTGQFDYHKIDVDEVAVRCDVDFAFVAGSGTFNPTMMHRLESSEGSVSVAEPSTYRQEVHEFDRLWETGGSRRQPRRMRQLLFLIEKFEMSERRLDI